MPAQLLIRISPVSFDVEADSIIDRDCITASFDNCVDGDTSRDISTAEATYVFCALVLFR